MLPKYYPTIVISDVHLGTEHSKAKELTHFLSSVNCATLILNGDIIDGWHLQKNGKGKWKKEHTELFKVIMKMMENQNTNVVYIRGNHDDFIDQKDFENYALKEGDSVEFLYFMGGGR